MLHYLSVSRQSLCSTRKVRANCSTLLGKGLWKEAFERGDRNVVHRGVELIALSALISPSLKTDTNTEGNVLNALYELKKMREDDNL